MLQELTALVVDYWFDVDFNWGRGAAAFYLDDGVFAIGELRMQGRDAIRDFYAWREGRGERTARHVVTNFRLEACDDERRRCAASCCSTPPTGHRCCRRCRPS